MRVSSDIIFSLLHVPWAPCACRASTNTKVSSPQGSCGKTFPRCLLWAWEEQTVEDSKNLSLNYTTPFFFQELMVVHLIFFFFFSFTRPSWAVIHTCRIKCLLKIICRTPSVSWLPVRLPSMLLVIVHLFSLTCLKMREHCLYLWEGKLKQSR